MKQRLEKVGLSLLRGFIGGAIVAFAGISYVPSLSGTFALGVAVTVGGLAAVLRLLQTYIPGLTTGVLLNKVGLGGATAVVDSGVRAFLASLATFAAGVLNAPDLSLSKAAVVAAITGAITAGIRAAQAVLTKGESPLPNSGT